MQQRTAYANACQQARNYFRRGLEVFEQANRQDLVARFIIPQAETLQKLQQWHELEMLAKKALVLHKLYADPFGRLVIMAFWQKWRSHGLIGQRQSSRQKPHSKFGDNRCDDRASSRSAAQSSS
jgi:hypothetical protein